MERFVSVISLKKDCPVGEMELLIEVKDSFIPQNNGLFLWKLDRKGSSLSPVKEESARKPHLSLGIGEMTSWLFGYGLPSVPADQMAMVERIRPLNGVFFDEVT